MDVEVIDKTVLHGHIIPGKTLLTRPQARLSEAEYPNTNEHLTLATMDNTKSYVSISGHEDNLYSALSKVTVSDVTRRVGSSIATIVKANIPVSNGVVHLISRPFMVTENSVYDYFVRHMQESEVSEFYRYVRE